MVNVKNKQVNSANSDNTNTNLLSFVSHASKFASSTAHSIVDDATSIAKQTVGRISDSIDVAVKGYSQYDVWGLGQHLIERVADITGFLSNQLYKQQVADWITNLKECEAVLRAYNVSTSTLLTLSDDIIEISDEKAYKDIAKKELDAFLPAWMWAYDNVIRNVRYAPIAGPRYYASMVQMRMPWLTPEHIDRMCSMELTRLASIIMEFIAEAHGYSDGYASSDRQLLKRDDEWGDKQALSTFLYARKWDNGGNDGDGDLSDVTYRTADGLIGIKTNKEIGLDFCAQTEDMLHVASTFNLLVSWIDPKHNDIEARTGCMLSMSECSRLLDGDKYDELDEQIESESRRCWRWLGVNALGLWD